MDCKAQDEVQLLCCRTSASPITRPNVYHEMRTVIASRSECDSSKGESGDGRGIVDGALQGGGGVVEKEVVPSSAKLSCLPSNWNLPRYLRSFH